jgi:hypothetical protein
LRIIKRKVEKVTFYLSAELWNMARGKCPLHPSLRAPPLKTRFSGNKTFHSKFLFQKPFSAAIS